MAFWHLVTEGNLKAWQPGWEWAPHPRTHNRYKSRAWKLRGNMSSVNLWSWDASATLRPWPLVQRGGAMGCLSPQEGVVGVWSHHCMITEGPLSSLRCPILPRGSLIVPPWLTWRKGAGPLVFKWDLLVSTKQRKHWKYIGYSQRKLSTQ